MGSITMHNVEYATISVSFVPLTLNELVRLSRATAFSGTRTARDMAVFVKEVGGLCSSLRVLAYIFPLCHRVMPSICGYLQRVSSYSSITWEDIVQTYLP